jgi:hypothetical protein
MQKRILNYRENYSKTPLNDVSSNYYPVTSAISIIDEEK